MSSNPGGRHPRKIVLIPIIILVSLFVLEGACRLLDLAPPLAKQWGTRVADEHLPYKHRPDAHYEGRSETDEYDYDYTHNSMGFRDIEHDLAKPDGVFRILGLGDSFTYGAGAAFTETYLYRLEQQLNERPGDHPPVEIVKAGQGRFFAEPERLLLQHYGLQYDPDLILVGFLLNDLVDTRIGMHAVYVDASGYLISREAQKMGRLGKWLFLNSHLFRAFVARLLKSEDKASSLPKWKEKYKTGGDHEQDWRKIESEYEKMIALAHDADATIVFFHIPHLGPWQPMHDYPGQRLAAWAQGNDVPFFDIFPAMKQAAATNERLYYEKDTHCTPAGYRVIAETLFTELTTAGLVP